ncbi:DUF2742 domain-containing protein [Mycobacteroides abscessus]|uniref:DUF2742 domain-containing protein n=1 Tax=Mycobacteroides abscessus TaxID=36809 RepID=UPI001ED99ECD|nr:DUF2742 domain-containing protein [Mycobacteroides abscessus]
MDAEPGPTRAGFPSSQQVSWWETHVFVNALVAQLDEPLPTAGSAAWCALAGGDPRKLLALAVAGEHWILRIETAQIAMADASRAISAAADWAKISRRTRQHKDFYASHPWLKRVSAEPKPAMRRPA